MNKDVFREMGGWSRIFFLCFFAFIGYIVGILISAIIGILFTQQGIELSASKEFLRISQVILALSIFLIPSVLYAYLFHDKPKTYLKVTTFQQPLFIVLVVLLMVVIQPFIYMAGYFNEQMVLPEFMAPVEQWMIESEKSSERLISLFLVDKSPLNYILNIFVIAIVAGVTEEIFFRGCLQQSVKKIVLNKNAAVWITAFIFSTVHLQFYGFVPRLLLGALLGYLFIWSGSIWVPVIAHTLHNALNVVLMQYYYGTPDYKEMQNMGIEQHIWLGILSFAISCLFLFLLYKKRKEGFAPLAQY